MTLLSPLLFFFVPLVIIVIGASGIIAQVVLIRELLVSFQGNEFSLGFILGNWLLAEALGCYLARRIKFTIQTYNLLFLLFALLLPILCIFAQIIRPVLGVLPGEIVTFPIMFIASWLTLLPIGFLHGALFTATNAYLVLSQTADINEQRIPGYVYTLENIGTIIGGIIIYFILIPYLSSLAIVLTTSMLNIFIVRYMMSTLKISYFFSKEKMRLLRLRLAKTKFDKSLRGSETTRTRSVDRAKATSTIPKTQIGKILLFLLLIIFGILIYLSPKIEHWAISRNFPKIKTIYTTNTIYSKITVTEHEEQYTFLLDGVPSIITPYPEQTFVEDYTHFPLLLHLSPKKILVLGGGAGGVLAQILKHPIDQIYYLELDPFLIKTIKKFPTPLTTQELSDERVKVITTDARMFLEKTPIKFDLIFVSFLNALTLQTNRFFTKEFFLTCKNRLNPDGILVTISPGSLTYLSPIMGDIINIRLNTLKSIFPYVIVIPGDFNLYLASSDKRALSLNAESLYARLVQRQIHSDLFSLGYIQYRISDFLLSRFWQALKQSVATNSTVNKDGLPQGLFYNLYYANTVANPKLSKLFSVIQKTDLKIISVITIIIFIILLLFRKRYGLSLYLPLTIFTTGMIAMVFSLVLSLGFQIRYGYLYYQISILLTTFIAGSAFGGYISNRWLPEKIRYFLLSEILIIILLIILGLTLQNQSVPQLIGTQIDFFVLLFISGFLGGLQFPLANKLLKTLSITLKVSKLYTADLLGGFLGAIIIPVCLFAVIGIFQTIIWALLLKIISVCLILTGISFRVE